MTLRQEAEVKFHKAEDDYRRDLEAINRLLERFCGPDSDQNKAVWARPAMPFRQIDSKPSELEAKIRNVMTRGNGASPWSAPTLYEIIKSDYAFPQKRDSAVNSVLSILKSWAARGIVHEQKGRGRRASLFTWDEALYPKGKTNGGVHYGPIDLPLPEITEVN